MFCFKLKKILISRLPSLFLLTFLFMHFCDGIFAATSDSASDSPSTPTSLESVNSINHPLFPKLIEGETFPEKFSEIEKLFALKPRLFSSTPHYLYEKLHRAYNLDLKSYEYWSEKAGLPSKVLPQSGTFFTHPSEVQNVQNIVLHLRAAQEQLSNIDPVKGVQQRKELEQTLKKTIEPLARLLSKKEGALHLKTIYDECANDLFSNMELPKASTGRFAGPFEPDEQRKNTLRLLLKICEIKLMQLDLKHDFGGGLISVAKRGEHYVPAVYQAAGFVPMVLKDGKYVTPEDPDIIYQTLIPDPGEPRKRGLPVSVHRGSRSKDDSLPALAPGRGFNVQGAGGGREGRAFGKKPWVPPGPASIPQR